MPFAALNGAQIYYDVHGTGTSIVFTHAGIADHRMWDRQVAAFADRYQVIRWDMRGYGQTAPTNGLYSHREDLITLLDALNVERAVLVGCSMGGGVCLDIALMQPQRVAALVMVASRPVGFTAEVTPSPYYEALIAADQAGDIERFNELEILQWVVGQGRTREQVDPAVFDLALNMNRIALNNEGNGDEKPHLDPPAVTRLAEIRIPTLILYGNHDVPIVPLAADHMEQHIAGARKVLMPNTAHLPNLERPDEFNRILDEFLRGAGIG